MANEKTKALILNMEAVLKENNIGVWEEDSEEEILDTDDIDLD